MSDSPTSSGAGLVTLNKALVAASCICIVFFVIALSGLQFGGTDLSASLLEIYCAGLFVAWCASLSSLPNAVSALARYLSVLTLSIFLVVQFVILYILVFSGGSLLD